MAGFEYLANGHHVDDAGNRMACTYGDFRDPAERYPITVLQKESWKRHATAGCVPRPGGRRECRFHTVSTGSAGALTCLVRRDRLPPPVLGAAPTLFGGDPRLRRSDAWKIRTARCTTPIPRPTSGDATRSDARSRCRLTGTSGVRQVATSTNLKPGVILRNAIKLGLVQLEKRARPGA